MRTGTDDHTRVGEVLFTARLAIRGKTEADLAVIGLSLPPVALAASHQRTSPVIAESPPPAGTEGFAVKWKTVTVPKMGVMLIAVARPSGEGPFPSVLILHGTRDDSRLSRSDREWIDRQLQYALSAVKTLHEHCAGLLLGSDAFVVVPGFSALGELEFFVRAGLTPYEALRTGTVNSRRGRIRHSGCR